MLCQGRPDHRRCAGQQSRIHCTRLAGNKADNWWLRNSEKVRTLPFIDGIRKCEADNAIDLYISPESDKLLADGVWQRYFTEKPAPFTAEEKAAWHKELTGVSLALTRPGNRRQWKAEMMTAVPT